MAETSSMMNLTNSVLQTDPILTTKPYILRSTDFNWKAPLEVVEAFVVDASAPFDRAARREAEVGPPADYDQDHVGQ